MTTSPIVGSLLGTAVGDALGLPYEGLSRKRAMKLLGAPDRHRLVFGRGMFSDDTEHTCMVAQSLIESDGSVDRFRQGLARRFRQWLMTVPAGIGLATLRAVVRLCVGYGPESSGVFSAGNGPAMRAPILGAAISDPTLLREFVKASTRITHTDPKAEYGALAVAIATQMSARRTPVSGAEFIALLESALQGEGAELMRLVVQAVSAADTGMSVGDFAEQLGLSSAVSGYVYHTVPVALHAWLSHPRDYRAAVSAVIGCGGDTDTTAAIVGGIVGAGVGEEGIPSDWVHGVIDWPRSIPWLRLLATQLDASLKAHAPTQAIRLPILPLLLRNLAFLIIVLGHGFRRLAPPY